MGLSVLPYMPQILESRKKIVDYYDSNLNFTKLSRLKIRENTQWNYSYYSVVFETEKMMFEIQKLLNEQKIFPRRYFYPSLNTKEFTRGLSMPISESIASRILCLPLSHELDIEDLDKIIKTINKY